MACIDVSRPGFLAPHDLPPVNHPIPQGIPFAAQPLQQVPLRQAVVEEGTASSSSLEEEINRFRFEEEAIVISEAKEEADEYSCIQTPAPIITYVGDSLDNEEEDMAPKTGPSLRELMKGRNKTPSPQEKSKSKPPVNPPPPQLPTDLGLKPNPDLRRKRHTEAPEEGEMGPSKGSKQPRQSQDQRSRRSNSVDSQEELLVAQVCCPTRTWSPKLEVDSVPIAWDASLRHYRGGHAGHVAEALEQPLILPKDMKAYRNFNHPELFLSLKRDLAMVSYLIHCSIYIFVHFLVFYSKGKTPFVLQVTQQVFVAEEWVKNARSEARATLDARSEVEVELGALKENHSKMAKQLKEAVKARDSAEAALKTTEKQFEDIRK